MAEKDFEIKIVTEADTSRILQHLRQYFYIDEPLNAYMDKNAKEKLNPSERGHTNTSCIKEGLSLMAVSYSNEIVGVAMNREYKRDIKVEDNTGEVNPSYIEVSEFLDTVEIEADKLLNLENPNTNRREMNIRIISVHPEWRNKKIGSSLLKSSCDFAKQRGFSQVRSLCTSAYSVMAFEKLGFRCICARKYEDYKKDGKVVFKPELPHTHVKLMVLKF